MAEHPDYYEILQVNRGATDSEIKRAYRKLAMKWHPDKNKDNLDEAGIKFQEIGEAYEVLSDKERRAIYDQYGYEGLRDGIPDSSGETKGGYTYKQNAQGIFESFFGTKNPFSDFGFGETMPFASRLQKPGPKKADPIAQDLPCTLEELFNGCTKRLKITRTRFDTSGELVESTKMLTINVKPGWKKGTKITFPCEGDERPNIIPADVVFVVTEKEHEFFGREGSNLIYNAQITLADALTDCCIEVPTLDGRTLSLPCPEVVSPGYEKTIVGEGMPLSKKVGQRGELIIRFKILFPRYLPEEKKAKLRQLLAGEVMIDSVDESPN
uniref:J domain-containing protein n=1 Tax=Fibrocapsa japonica TaxID=94617 RepID=A0A7S2V156_9STRA|mmetsp:Transcript_24131/g.35089  ORF Transcript_24131/g.35089 Transcript_24131/m.35089 type:complete len:325 (+) Transcript_24131:141-1115(+)|eukprot:CAMPEP_0113935010 /NCGR_PEP_ID=MMETSP1339-20121228/2249_1 /TAXON_ID=94617 /ORGANISM="Fibrocapsa japonica" /LENGTH=324 /DNA_ID=CAMNT_0000937023 /DNA_START=64 /DNA_END=1038 /DNA_ORIENTATION=- /assembly_acc=CAM_ASM_000762